MLNKLSKKEQIFYYTLLTAIGFLMIAPLFYMISIGLASSSTVMTGKFTLFPREFNFSTIQETLFDKRILLWMKNSIVITFLNIIGQVFSSAFVAYGFARSKYKYKNYFFAILLLTMMIPGQITMIPTFIIWNKLGFYNTIWPLVLPNFFGHAFNIFLIRQFIMRISYDIDEAAIIDGASFFQIFTKIHLPQLKPILITIAIFTFQGSWGDFFGPLLYISDKAKTTLAYGVQILSTPPMTGVAPPWNVVMVASMLLTIPMILVFYFGQRRIFSSDVSIGSVDK